MTPTPKRKDTRKGDRHRPGYMATYLKEWRRKRREAASVKATGENQ